MTEQANSPNQASPRPALFLDGLRDVMPVMVSIIPFALLLGGLAAQKGLSVATVFIMSATFFTGSGQFVAVTLWEDPLPVTVLIVTAAGIGLRHILMGASLAPAMDKVNPVRGMAALFFLVDETWALAMRRVQRGEFTARYFLGMGILLWANWVTMTTLGAVFGGLVPDPRAFGVDFAFAAIFIVLLLDHAGSKSQIAVMVVAAIVSIVGHRFYGPAVGILAGGLAGTLVGALVWKPAATRETEGA